MNEELAYHLTQASYIVGAALFIDGGNVWRNVSEMDISQMRGSVGFGLRYRSPVGPIRVDLGINPSRAEELAVVTELERNGRLEIVPLETPRRYSAGGGGSGIGRILNRLTLHLSIGQAY